MLTFPNCKINIGLFVTNRRADGYHDLETIFYPIHSLHDALEIMPSSEKTSLHIDGKPIAGNTEDNLIWKAYNLLKGQYAGVPELDIYLLKAIPMGAGLGGGSADGAFMLKLLNDYCKLGLDDQTLAGYALELGSDCPFFIYNTPQFAKGRGEQLSAVSLDLSNFSLQLVCPQVHVSTGKAFGMITPKAAPFDLQTINDISVVDWKHHISNDFEAPVFAMHPELEDIKKQLYNQGALYAAMSGSGSTIYGLFPKGQKASVLTDIPHDSYFME